MKLNKAKKEQIAECVKLKEDLETRIENLYDLFLKAKDPKERERIASDISILEIKLSCMDRKTVETRYFGLQEYSTYRM